MTKSVTVVLGAGASFDVRNASVPMIDRSSQPPLAVQLFEERFHSERSAYRGARVLGAELGGAAAAGGTFDLEDRLTKFAQSTDAVTRRNFLEIPPYLRDVIHRCATRYVPDPANYLRLVQQLLEPPDHVVSFLLLNYDSMLETALSTFDRSLQFRTLDDYVRHPRVKVIKLHGSTNWFVELPDSRQVDWESALDSVPDDLAILEPSLHIDERHDPTHRLRHRETGNVLYPWLTAPVKDKSFTCPANHIEVATEELERSQQFLIVGTSGVDEDLLELLRIVTSHGNGRANYVQYVDPSSGTCRRFSSAVPQFRYTIGNLQLQQNPTTLSQFLNTDGIAQFLNVLR